MVIYKKALFTVIILLFSVFSFSQKKHILLETHLKKIEHHFKVNFNYESTLIKNTSCEVCFFNEKESLEYHLSALHKELQLDFTLVTPTKIVISKPGKKYLLFFDADYKTPIPDVFITDYGTNNTWVTNANGELHFKNTVPEEITISHLKYGKQTIVLDSLKGNNIELERITQNLDELFIYSYFTNGIYKNNDGSFLIKPDKINFLAGQTSHDVIKSIENLPQVVSNSESVADLIIRGGTQDQNLFVWNNIKVYQNHHFFGLISAFNENLISSINLYDNATPARYGNNTSGVISLEHNSEISKKTSGGLGINFLSQDAYLKVPISKKSEIQLSGRKSTTEFWKSQTYLKYSKKVFQSSFVDSENALQNDDITNQENFRFYDVQFQYTYKLNDKNTLNVNGIYLKNHLSYTEEDVQNVNSKKSDLEQNNMALGANWEHYFANKSQIKTSFNYSKHIMEGSNFLLSKDIASNEYNSIANYESLLEYTSKNFASGFNYSLGFAYDYLLVVNNTTNFNSLFISKKHQNNSIYNVFAAVNYQKNKIDAAFVLHNAYYEFLNSNQIEPRFYFTYKFSPQFNVQLRGERKTQNLSQIVDLENNFLGIEKRRWTMANNTVSPIQKSNQIDVTVNLKTNKSNLSAGVYHKKVNGITTSNQGFQNLHQFENQFGKYIINGFQAHYNFKTRNFNTWISYNYGVNKYEFKSLAPSVFYNNNDIRNRVISGVNYKYKAFNLALGMEYYSGKPFTTINNEQPINLGVFNTINYNTPNTERLSNYLRFDSTISYQFNFEERLRVKIAFGMINITNRENILNRYYTLSEDKQSVEVLDKYGLEFTPNLSLNIDF
ncbi:TonB-dependent receptor plug domain-containing protein [Neotamlana laminarinivorans]|uniref:TonB-dependent receptor plug domain-containing protein n=1 Tax=Neotamlana laminarinivorans TaxID=2883124 RepID=A0A9X1L456_9FLAO|nr:TonB-dependent receptor plug domain-containing protein [Tamlana laminarinivorans]MCB4798942.1 TonB-dependent receptor plug domain-containing protein [Tamlana laminarinivorans]